MDNIPEHDYICEGSDTESFKTTSTGTEIQNSVVETNHERSPSVPDSDPSPTRRLANKAKRKSRALKAKTKDAFRSKHKRTKRKPQQISDALRILEDDYKPQGDAKEDITTKVMQKAMAIGSSIKHPKKIGKSMASSAMSKYFAGFELDPFRLTEDDIAFIEVSEARSGEEDGTQNREQDEQLQKLKIARRRMLVNWVTDRHLPCARVVSRQERTWPKMSEMETMNTGLIRDDRRFRWVGQVFLYLTQSFLPVYVSQWEEVPRYERKIMLSHVERIVIGIGPIQDFVMRMRRVYRWEKPDETAKWLVGYTILWYFQYIFTFLFAYFIYRVVRNRFDGEKVERVRESIYRSRDQGQTVYRLNELVERHGSSGWVEALPDSLGAWGQMKLGDFANYLEMLRNFFEWRYPEQTLYTLCYFSVAFLLILLTDTVYCMKIGTFVAGILFFGSAPIESRWPKYRMAVSPFQWIFWGNPTHAEVAYHELQKDAVELYHPRLKAKLASEIPDEDPRCHYVSDWDDDEDEGYHTTSETSNATSSPNYIPNLNSAATTSNDEPTEKMSFCSFRCGYESHLGKLQLTRRGLQYQTELRGKIIFLCFWEDIVALHKAEDLSVGKYVKVDALVIDIKEGKSFRLNAMHHRDKAFNEIIGLSGLRWQCIL